MRVAIVHPWFPQYRKPFFDAILPMAARLGITIDVFHGPPPPEWNKRGDAVAADYATELPTRFIRVGRRALTFKSVAPLREAGAYDLIVLEQAVRNLETYKLLFSDPKQKFAFWGHGKSYTQSSGVLQSWVKQRLTQRGKWFFAYTNGGARAVRAGGFSGTNITVVENSIDSRELADQAASISIDEVKQFSEKYDLGDHTALFIGGIDEAKRIPFLLEAGSFAHQLDDRFRLVIAGGGAQEEMVIRASEKYHWLKYVGKVHGRDKALVMKSCSVLAMPGRVGLVAVDSFAVGRPIVTTNWPYHAPEYEYLRPGIDSIITQDTVSIYGQALVDLLSDRAQLTSLQSGCLESQSRYTIKNMADNFLAGLVEFRNSYHKEAV
jgi:glycosyltransferase involved in cell wall biosynthesis